MSDWIKGTITATRDWTEQHFSLQIDCRHPGFIAGQFVRIGLPEGDNVLARPYSCVNPPTQAGIEIYLNRVPDGPLSNRLAQLIAGDSVLVSPSANGFLTLDETPRPAKDLWLIASGTGIGPFLSMLQTREIWERFAQVNLAYGVREKNQLAYADLLDQLASQHPSLHRLYCISREQHPESFHGRVTDALRNGTLEAHCGLQLEATHSHVLLCGNKNMISEMAELLAERGLKKHRRRDPGQVSSEKYH